jgi:hypothetical protein
MLGDRWLDIVACLTRLGHISAISLSDMVELESSGLLTDGFNGNITDDGHE